MQNVQKDARASQATVRLEVKDSSLGFEVEDDGVGFDPATLRKGWGTQNMEDRLDAPGGSVTFASAPGPGTRVAGTIPVGVALAAEAS